MNVRFVVNRFMQNAAVGASVWCLVLAAMADPGQFTHSMKVAVFADHYVAGRYAFDDLNHLERHAIARHVGRVELIEASAAEQAADSFESNFPEIGSDKQDVASEVMGGAPSPVAEPFESNFPEIETDKQDAALEVMGGARSPVAEPFESNFPEVETDK
jgi:hypothetical protein